jgi:hypothetical protein
MFEKTPGNLGAHIIHKRSEDPQRPYVILAGESQNLSTSTGVAAGPLPTVRGLYPQSNPQGNASNVPSLLVGRSVSPREPGRFALCCRTFWVLRRGGGHQVSAEARLE